MKFNTGLFNFHRLRVVRRWLARKEKHVWELWQGIRTGRTHWYNIHLPLEDTDEHPSGRLAEKVDARRLKLEDYRKKPFTIMNFTPLFRKK